jgi:hypothetical protein
MEIMDISFENGTNHHLYCVDKMQSFLHYCRWYL